MGRNDEQQVEIIEERAKITNIEATLQGKLSTINREATTVNQYPESESKNTKRALEISSQKSRSPVLPESDSMIQNTPRFAARRSQHSNQHPYEHKPPMNTESSNQNEPQQPCRLSSSPFTEDLSKAIIFKGLDEPLDISYPCDDNNPIDIDEPSDISRIPRYAKLSAVPNVATDAITSQATSEETQTPTSSNSSKPDSSAMSDSDIENNVSSIRYNRTYVVYYLANSLSHGMENKKKNNKSCTQMTVKELKCEISRD
ncbi:hypothetical protein RND71_035178 [Anisodus tanguticus]|uniref:Uncharacterized protein n=1 Tax=Anisodus tanguticus TaxID=243964 RepID=A0AAE1R783_9SOLA|nr:hypothetical protein RND71_035178 [Anisodus tanguticus]